MGLTKTNRTGALPETAGFLNNLTFLQLGDNQITGPIPDGILDLPYMGGFQAANNHLTGGITLTSGIVGNVNFGILNVAGNALSGTIPEALGLIRNLSKVDMSGNLFDGEIPCFLQTLQKLQTVDFRWNALDAGCDGLTQFLDQYQTGGNWESFQTVPPTNVWAGTAGEVPMRVSWTPIPYSGEEGAYIVYAYKDGSPAAIQVGHTADKTVDHLDIATITAGVPYHFFVPTVTEPCADNANEVGSDASEVVTAAAVTPPSISQAAIVQDPFRLKVTGQGFYQGCVVKIGGVAVPETQWKSGTKVMAGKGATLKDMLPKGQMVEVTMRLQWLCGEGTACALLMIMGLSPGNPAVAPGSGRIPPAQADATHEVASAAHGRRKHTEGWAIQGTGGY